MPEINPFDAPLSEGTNPFDAPLHGDANPFDAPLVDEKKKGAVSRKAAQHKYKLELEAKTDKGPKTSGPGLETPPIVTMFESVPKKMVASAAAMAAGGTNLARNLVRSQMGLDPLSPEEELTLQPWVTEDIAKTEARGVKGDIAKPVLEALSPVSLAVPMAKYGMVPGGAVGAGLLDTGLSALEQQGRTGEISPREAVQAGAESAGTIGAMHGLSGIENPLLRSAATGGTMAGLTAARGGDTGDVLASGLSGGVLGAATGVERERTREAAAKADIAEAKLAEQQRATEAKIQQDEVKAQRAEQDRNQAQLDAATKAIQADFEQQQKAQQQAQSQAQAASEQQRAKFEDNYKRQTVEAHAERATAPKIDPTTGAPASRPVYDDPKFAGRIAQLGMLVQAQAPRESGGMGLGLEEATQLADRARTLAEKVHDIKWGGPPAEPPQEAMPSVALMLEQSGDHRLAKRLRDINTDWGSLSETDQRDVSKAYAKYQDQVGQQPPPRPEPQIPPMPPMLQPPESNMGGGAPPTDQAPPIGPPPAEPPPPPAPTLPEGGEPTGPSWLRRVTTVMHEPMVHLRDSGPTGAFVADRMRKAIDNYRLHASDYQDIVNDTEETTKRAPPWSKHRAGMDDLREARSDDRSVIRHAIDTGDYSGLSDPAKKVASNLRELMLADGRFAEESNVHAKVKGQIVKAIPSNRLPRTLSREGVQILTDTGSSVFEDAVRAVEKANHPGAKDSQGKPIDIRKAIALSPPSPGMGWGERRAALEEASGLNIPDSFVDRTGRRHFLLENDPNRLLHDLAVRIPSRIAVIKEFGQSMREPIGEGAAARNVPLTGENSPIRAAVQQGAVGGPGRAVDAYDRAMAALHDSSIVGDRSPDPVEANDPTRIIIAAGEGAMDGIKAANLSNSSAAKIAELVSGTGSIAGPTRMIAGIYDSVFKSPKERGTQTRRIKLAIRGMDWSYDRTDIPSQVQSAFRIGTNPLRALVDYASRLLYRFDGAASNVEASEMAAGKGNAYDRAMLRSLHYSEDMVKRFTEGKATDDEYKALAAEIASYAEGALQTKAETPSPYFNNKAFARSHAFMLFMMRNAKHQIDAFKTLADATEEAGHNWTDPTDWKGLTQKEKDAWAYAGRMFMVKVAGGLTYTALKAMLRNGPEGVREEWQEMKADPARFWLTVGAHSFIAGPLAHLAIDIGTDHNETAFQTVLGLMSYTGGQLYEMGKAATGAGGYANMKFGDRLLKLTKREVPAIKFLTWTLGAAHITDYDAKRQSAVNLYWRLVAPEKYGGPPEARNQRKADEEFMSSMRRVKEAANTGSEIDTRDEANKIIHAYSVGHPNAKDPAAGAGNRVMNFRMLSFPNTQSAKEYLERTGTKTDGLPPAEIRSKAETRLRKVAREKLGDHFYAALEDRDKVFEAIASQARTPIP